MDLKGDVLGSVWLEFETYLKPVIQIFLRSYSLSSLKMNRELINLKTYLHLITSKTREN